MRQQNAPAAAGGIVFKESYAEPANAAQTHALPVPVKSRSSVDSGYANSLSSVNSVTSRHPSSYVAQVERFRQYPQWSSGVPSPQHPSGGAGNAAAAASGTSTLGCVTMTPQRSQLSSLLAQSRRGSAQSLRYLPTPQPPAEPTLEARKSIDYPWSHENTSSPPRPLEGESDFPGTIMRDLQRPPRLKTFHFANCNTSQVLRMITLVLETKIKKNDRLYPPGAEVNPLGLGSPANDAGLQFQSTLLRFHGCNVPGIGLDAYFDRILKYCPSTADVFISLLVYLDRIATKGFSLSSNPESSLFFLDSYNVHRLVIAGMTVASKFFSDVFYKNSRYAKVGGLSVEELNNLELQFLLLLDFKLLIGIEELQRYADFILNYQDAAAVSGTAL